jgi:hypothetical protein
MNAHGHVLDITRDVCIRCGAGMSTILDENRPCVVVGIPTSEPGRDREEQPIGGALPPYFRPVETGTGHDFQGGKTAREGKVPCPSLLPPWT